MEKQKDAALQRRKCSRLLLFPLPLQGHINPMIQLAEILHAKGFSITVIQTKFNALNPEIYPHFTFHTISDGLSDSEASKINAITLILELNSRCIAPFQCALSKLLAESSLQDPIACLISDAILHFTRAVADSFKLPRVVLRTGGLSSYCAFSLFPLLIEKGYLPIQDARLEEPVLELPPLKVKDIPMIKSLNLESLVELVNLMVQETKASSGLIFNSFEELEQPALVRLQDLLSIPIFPIGPFHKYFPATSSSLMTQDKSCISWLEKQVHNSVIYVSFGSLAALDEKEFVEIAWGLANSKHPFLWVVRPGLIAGSEWLEALPNGFLDTVDGRGLIVKWAPQPEVLAHPAVGAFLTHNGWNSTLESICEGVPMLCMPRFTDQPVNARYVTNVWRVGLALENGLDRDKIEMTVKKLMEEKEGEEIRERMLQLKGKASLCLNLGGSSHQSLESLASFISSF
ncbi:hypothetical protein ACH5RR_019303 [Cinchona calisaya]|uniref:Glycosyltransferase n=1 Tax=Cinchona calisaya TaxID=153742 RepID=A0ABD2ZP88_9GENT